MRRKVLLSNRKLWSLHAAFKFTILTLGFLHLNSTTSFSQVRNYEFSQSNGVYTEISTTLNVLHGTGVDDALTDLQIPFNFPYNGSTYDRCQVSSNGHIVFGQITGNGTSTPHTNTLARGVISPFGRDLKSNLETAISSSQAMTLNGERALIVQFKNWGVLGQSESNLNFQVQLFESGLIKFVYGTFSNTAAAANTAIIGLRGPSTADFNYRTNSTTQLFSASTNATANTNSQAYNFTVATPGVPASGLTYTWTPSATACFVPGITTVSNILTTGAEISVNTTASLIDYEVRTSGNAGTGNSGLVRSGVAVSPNTIITGLQPNTSYTVYTRANCNGTTTSWSTLSTTFRTACNSSTLPYFEGFNTSTLNTCWTNQIISNSTTNYLSYPATTTAPAIAAHEGLYFARYNSAASGSVGHVQRLTTSIIDATGVNDIAVEFKFFQMTSTSNPDRVVVNYSIDNGSTWTILDSVLRYNPTIEADGWRKVQYILPPSVDNASNLRIALDFKGEGGQNMGLDSFYVRPVPAPRVTSHDDLISCATPNQGATVRIEGQYLHRANVTINGVSQTPIEQDLTHIVLQLPATTEGEVRLTTPNGTYLFEDWAFIYLVPSITTREVDTRVCVNTPVGISITSPLTDYNRFELSFENTPGSINGTAETGYQISSPTAQNLIITGIKEINGFECNLNTTIFLESIPGPGIVRQFTEVTTCENELLNLSFFDALYPTGMTGPNGGTASTGTSTPHFVVNNYGGTRNQTIYTAAELRAMGWEENSHFTALSFETTAITAFTRDSLKVRIGHTNQAVATSTFINAGLEENLGPIQWAPQLGVNTFTFTNPFIWDGISNIVIDITHSSATAGNGTGSISIIREVVTTAAVVNRNADRIPAIDMYDIETGTVNSTQRTKFTLFSGVPTPTAADNIIQWQSQQRSLYLNNLGDVPFNNEGVAQMWYRTTAANDTIQVRVSNNIGCLSEARYIVNTIPTIRENIYEEACNFYVHRGNYLTRSGIYIDTFTSRITGCDSLYILNLRIDNPTVYTPSIIACGAYDLNGRILTSSGNYTSTFTNVSGCDSIVNVNLTIIDRIIPQIYAIGDTLYATSNVPNALYQWRNCTTGMIIPGANGPSFHPQSFGTYNVLVAEGTCNGTSVCAVYGAMGIEILEKTDLVVSPNPTTGIVTISYDSEEQMNATIMDASGKEIATTSIYSGSKIDLSSFVPGIYLIKVESSTSNQVVRIVKQ